MRSSLSALAAFALILFGVAKCHSQETWGEHVCAARAGLNHAHSAHGHEIAYCNDGSKITR